MKQLFIVRFRLKTSTSSIFTESCESTLFATSYDDAKDQVVQVFGSYLGFEVGTIKPIGQPIIPDVKEIKQLS